MAAAQIATILLLLLCSLTAGAQTVDEATRAAARELAEEGGVLYQDEKWAPAFEKLDKAYGILRVPSLGFYSGQCLERMGRWVEASERYLDVTKLPIPERGADVHMKAQADAQAARELLLPRIPRLRIVVTGADAADLTLSVDGAAVAAATLDVPLPMDPGEHVVVAARGDERVERTAVLKEGAETRLEIPFEPASGPKLDPEPVPLPPSPDPPDVQPAAPREGSDGLRIGGFVLLGIGGAALVTGVITGAVLLAKSSSLDDSCVDNDCTFGAEGDVDTYNALRPTTTVMLAVGGAAVAAGLVMVLVFD